MEDFFKMLQIFQLNKKLNTCVSRIFIFQYQGCGDDHCISV